MRAPWRLAIARSCRAACTVGRDCSGTACSAGAAPVWPAAPRVVARRRDRPMSSAVISHAVRDSPASVVQSRRSRRPCPGIRSPLERVLDGVLRQPVPPDHREPARGSVDPTARQSCDGGNPRRRVAGWWPGGLPGAPGRGRRHQHLRPQRHLHTSTGLGLAIGAAVVRAHNGSVEAANRVPGPGATVSITVAMARPDSTG